MMAIKGDREGLWQAHFEGRRCDQPRAPRTVIFNDKRARLDLERATHPLILREMRELIGRLKGIVVVDVPLLFEKKSP